jgi:RNA polymerase sigma factor (sigma-70 family)
MTSIDNGSGDPAVGSDEAADADLVLRTRSGDRGAFGELWYRHYRSGIAVARSMSGLDPDDLVQEAYARIYQSILRGGGPTGSFRAYLFTSIRNTAAAWGRSGRETAMEDLDAVVDPATSDDATESALDRSLTHRAFRSLPSRWQEVLWYSEIEQMKPAEIAPLLGMKPAAVAQLAFRAREGLREAWIQAHLQSLADGSDCQRTIERLGAHARANLSRRDQSKVDTHLARCTRCTIVAAEAKEVSSRLALVLLPLTLGITGSAGYLATLQGGGAPVVALAAGQGVMPVAMAAPSGVTASVACGSGAGSTAVGSVAVGGSVAAGGGAVAAGGGAVATSAAVGASTAAAVGAAAGAGGFFSSVSAVIGATAAAALIVGSAVSVSIAAEEILPSSWEAAGATSLFVESPADPGTGADTAMDAGADADGDAEGSTLPGTIPGSDAGSDAGGDAGTVAMPAGIPSIGSAGVTYAGTQPTFTVAVSGAPGATVELLVNGGIKASARLDAVGAGILAFTPSLGHVTNDAVVNVRYRAGELTGQPLTVRLSALADLVAVRAIMKGAPAVAPPTEPSTASEVGDEGLGSADQDPPGLGSANGQGPRDSNGTGNGNSGNPLPGAPTGSGVTNVTPGGGSTHGIPAGGAGADRAVDGATRTNVAAGNGTAAETAADENPSRSTLDSSHSSRATAADAAASGDGTITPATTKAGAAVLTMVGDGLPAAASGSAGGGHPVAPGESG